MVATTGDFSEHGVLAVQPTGRCHLAFNQEKLTATGVGLACFGH